MSTAPECFGFFNDSVSCQSCVAVKRCRAILVSDGFDIMTALLSEVLEQEATSPLPFFVTEKVSDQVDQLLHPSVRESMAKDNSILEELFGADEKPAEQWTGDDDGGILLN